MFLWSRRRRAPPGLADHVSLGMAAPARCAGYPLVTSCADDRTVEPGRAARADGAAVCADPADAVSSRRSTSSSRCSRTGRRSQFVTALSAARRRSDGRVLRTRPDAIRPARLAGRTRAELTTRGPRTRAGPRPSRPGRAGPAQVFAAGAGRSQREYPRRAVFSSGRSCTTRVRPPVRLDVVPRPSRLTLVLHTPARRWKNGRLRTCPGGRTLGWPRNTRHARRYRLAARTPDRLSVSR